MECKNQFLRKVEWVWILESICLADVQSPWKAFNPAPRVAVLIDFVF